MIYLSLQHSKPQQKKGGKKHENYYKCMWKWEQGRENEKECKKIKQTNKKKVLENVITKIES